MTTTTLDILRARIDHVGANAIELVEQFSGMHPASTATDSIVVINPHGSHRWNMLPPAGKRIQSKLLPAVDRVTELTLSLIRNLPNGVQHDVKGWLETLRSSVEQDGATSWATVDEAVEGVRELTNRAVSTLEAYSATCPSDALAIADTNALLFNPDVEHWHFEGVDRFTIILTPVVLSELDGHKVNHRNQHVRETACTVIRKIKEYRRRGPMHDGVVVVKQRVFLRSVAAEPDMAQSLSWFRPGNADDRFLAGAIEVMRGDLGKPTFIVTADINMQNKADMAGLPFREVPASPVGREEVSPCP